MHYGFNCSSLIASQKANYHQSQAKNKTSFTDSSVFILELWSGTTGPCCNTPYLEANSSMMFFI